ncbi:MAG: hypothetical protein JWP65_811 [Ramlibacter sp.]|jgi:hypothetical protein|uniref:DUF2474 family protein n=1 Tax=Ramlibacter sp. TaxID=1917967 RepID=UPI00262B2786|nr:DUF2474 family protein [Ramlibacter sp.]MDB5750390.1 hypothetical protein [Ramlibacter sp.]
MPVSKAPRRQEPPGWLSRVAWLLGLWLAGVAGLGAAAWLLKALMRAVGFS